jgi:HAD superfamily phosphatase (TIGR01681 family)
MMFPSNLKLVIFDLDETLHFNKQEVMPLHIPSILTYFKQNNTKIALASLNTMASAYLYKYNIIEFFDAIECRKERQFITEEKDYYEWRSLRKNKMMKRLMKQFECSPNEILFFDDLKLHIDDISKMGIHCIHVDKNKCISWRDIFNGLEECKKNTWSRRQTY